MSNFSGVELVWTAFALWGFIRGCQLAYRYIVRRRLLTASGQNGFLQTVAGMGVGRAVSTAAVEGLFLFGGVLAMYAPPRPPHPFLLITLFATYGLLLGAGIMAAWAEVELRLDTIMVEAAHRGHVKP